ncbi:DUF6531 domain-containing protein [Actinomycetospora endophytica]|uniref:DUF6531 domain-containing protein n=1 Tax=Actinomycetospora endophytica TaxID=2291215 RepID=A0ABS8P8A0_9PSEU|nr:RHS repeat-associated core domain-containing protein [Actinomycetospora endophytica]MCD2194478.1 DUF6531 domain-containing protein [Actinomycetospora endophytica]
MAEGFTSAGEGIRAAGNSWAAGWTGGAAQAASAQVGEVGAKAAVGADVSRAVGQALTTYASELRAAQEQYLRGEQMVAAGQADVARSTTAMQNLQTTERTTPASAQKDAAFDAADAAVSAAQGRVAEGQRLMQEAVQREQAANAAAATSVQGAQGQLAGMTAPVPGAAGAVPAGAPGTPGQPGQPPPAFTAAPATPPPEEESGFSWTDIAHTALDVAGLVPGVGEVFDGANAAWYASEGDYLNAGLSAAAMVPFAGSAATGLKVGLKAGEAATDLAKAGTHLAPEAAAAVKTSEVPASGLHIDMAPSATTPPSRALSIGEPVDVGTGHLLLPAVDVELPGVLPLVVERLHRSSYRSGRFFGPSWASTLDEHVVVTDTHVVLARADAVALRFPPDGGPAVEDDRWTLTRDGASVVVDDLDGERRRHFSGHGAQRWLTAVVDHQGRRYDVDRLADGTPLEIRHHGGYRVTVLTARDRIVGYDLVGAGPDGSDRALVRFGYEAGNLTAVVTSSGLPTRFGYDDRGRMTGWADRRGTWFRHEYDDEDRVVRQVGSGGVLSCSFDYDHDIVTRTDSLGAITRYVHDDAGRVVQVTDPLGGERRTEYDDAGRVTAVVDELGRTTRFGHDPRGLLDRVERPDGSVVTVVHDDAGRPVLVRDADGAEWTHEFDDAGRRVATTDPLGAITRYAHGEHGFLVAVTDALGGVRRLENDAAGLPVAVVDRVGAVTRWERDALGRVVAETDPTGLVTRYTWTLEGRLATVTAPDGGVERRLYDPEGNLASSTDAVGQVTRFEHTHFDLVAARVDPDGSRHEQAWDSEMRLVGVTNPQGLRWSYEYDAAGRLVAETDFDDRRTTYALDATGALRRRTNALGETVEFAYGPLGQVSERRADGVLTTYDHDAAGRLVRATTPDVDVVITRDASGRVLGEATNGRELISSYDALGRRIGRITPTGQRSEWAYAADSTVTSLVAGVAMDFDHDVAGRETRRRAGRAVVEQDWDAGRLVEQRLEGAFDRRFRYRPDGSVVGIGARAFDVDAQGRVTAVRGGGWSERYAYDAGGNTVAASWPGADPELAGAREFSGTTLRRAGRATYGHDAAGRVVRRTRGRLSRPPESWQFRWDALDQLVGVTTPDGSLWRYVYDAFGRRVSKQRLDPRGGSAEQVDFTWDGATLVEEVRYADAGVSSTAWDHDASGLRPVSQRSRWRAAGQAEVDERFYAIVTDLVGAPTELLAPDGSVAGQARRSLWGRTSWTGVSTPLLFPGQYLDTETGLAQNLHRYYDPDTARYTSLDPLGLAPAPNPAAYVHNPLTWADPLGLNPCAAPLPGSGGQKALPPGKPQWGGSQVYNKGGRMTAIEHINYRHGPYSSSSTPAGRFDAGTSAHSIKSHVDDALSNGSRVTDGRGGETFEHDIGRQIGLDADGKPTTRIRVHARDGQIRTAFPY